MIEFNYIIKSSIVTEKASLMREKFNRYSLYVAVNVNKHQIKSAIEFLFSVKVASINVLRVKPRSRRFRGVIGYKKQKKKVYFSLVGDQKLDIMGV